MKFHCAYHPQSGGAVERINGTLKSRLTMVMGKTGLDSVQALPIVLTGIRGRVHEDRMPPPWTDAGQGPGRCSDGELQCSANQCSEICVSTGC